MGKRFSLRFVLSLGPKVSRAKTNFEKKKACSYNRSEEKTNGGKKIKGSSERNWRGSSVRRLPHEKEGGGASRGGDKKHDTG